MTTIRLPVPDPELQRQLDQAESQLALYARDLRRIIDAERVRSAELEQANSRLQFLDRVKTDFLTFISNEVRNAIDHANGAIEDPSPRKATPTSAGDAAVRAGFERLDASLSRAQEYFSWLAIDRVNANETADLVRIVQRGIDNLRDQGQAKVTWQPPNGRQAVPVRGREEPVAKVVAVLLDNAVAFSPGRKEIAVDMQLVSNRVRLHVTDKGIGFDPVSADEIFLPFTIGDPRHETAGGGLSLAIAQAIVQAYGGKIRAQSLGEGLGATFTLELPVHAPAA
jgi:signal transduction histidine kinase